MNSRPGSNQFFLAAIISIFTMSSSLAAYAGDNSAAIRALANQMCPDGSFVIGFDSEGNIICAEGYGNSVQQMEEAGDDGKAEMGDDCPAACPSEGVVSEGVVSEGVVSEGDEEKLAGDTSTTGPSSLSSIPALVISDVEPASLVWGTSELAITVIGTGFNAESVIIFEGSSYKAVVNQAGTQMDTTLATADLGIGSYTIKVSNGPGQVNTLKRALVVY
jgi:hypothetical protein